MMMLWKLTLKVMSLTLIRLRGLSVRVQLLVFRSCSYGTAFKNKGVQPLLDAVVDFMPSPLDIADVQGC